MSAFMMRIMAVTEHRNIGEVTSFVGEDCSGSFGIQAYHAKFMTSLIFGVAKFRVAAKNWQYLAMPGALLYFCNNELVLFTRQFLIDDDLVRINESLLAQYQLQFEHSQNTRASLDRMELAMYRRLMSLQQNAE